MPPDTSPSPLADYSTCELSDALLKLGVVHGGHISDIHMISPSPSSSIAESARLCGPAYTVRMVLTSDASSPKLNGHFVDLAPEGSVIFIDVPPEARNAVWGGLMTAGAIVRNCQGTIVSGRIRDTSEHRAASYPLFARGTSTVGQSPFTRPSQVNVPVAVGTGGNLGSVMVSPGDWLVADLDGVICVPRELAEEAAALAAQGREVDSRCLEDIKKGVGVAESFKRHRGKKPVPPAQKL
ncbi:hypothetical protein EW146_g1379 [Bondarzewia mesenterica]|uniref:RraA-like protein n=1 Tax=Bondarzewia mesenterica TaxID=1095465 RepID=A0A4S4M3T9_9AGAM|nr:hypothetical protein EW146_g1379 [Bondarzewia mesenterica]